MRLVFVPLQHPFVVRALLTAAVVGAVCAVVGTYVVLRGMAFFGDALAHAILPGLAVGYLTSGGAREALFWWALGTAVLASLGIGTISRSNRIREDTAIGIVFAGLFALGIALISTQRSYSVDLAHFLFGNILGVSASDLIRTVAFGAGILLIVFLFYKEFLVIAFDPVLAATLRLPARLFEYLLLVLISITVVVSLQTVGVALMVAMLVTPAATASLLARRLPALMALAAAIAAGSGVVGIYLSYYANLASGASIVLVCTAVFGLVWTAQALQRRFTTRHTRNTQ